MIFDKCVILVLAPCIMLSNTYLFIKLRGIGPGIMTRINEFLYASEAMESRRESKTLLPFLDSSNNRLRP